MNLIISTLICMCFLMGACMPKPQFEKDTIKTSAGDLEITFIGHGTLMFKINGKIIHVDPWSNLADYSKLPEADIILITHQHADHLDPAAIKNIQTENTKLIINELSADRVEKGMIMKNGDEKDMFGFKIIAVPAYNIEHKRENGLPFHPEGEGNGYIIIVGETRIYIGGDTENTPEMKSLENIDIAFLPMNLPYTMTPEMVADAVLALKPRILYPYHYGDTDMAVIIDLLSSKVDTEIRIRKLR